MSDRPPDVVWTPKAHPQQPQGVVSDDKDVESADNSVSVADSDDSASVTDSDDTVASAGTADDADVTPQSNKVRICFFIPHKGRHTFFFV